MTSLSSARLAFLFWLLPSGILAQPEPLMVNEVAPAVNIGYHCYLYLDHEKSPVPEKFFSEDLRPISPPDHKGNDFYTLKKNPEGSYWIHFEAINNSLDSITVCFYFGRFLKSRLYTFNLFTAQKEETDLEEVFLKNRDFVFPVTFSPQSQYRIWVFLSEPNTALTPLVFFTAGMSSERISGFISDRSSFFRSEKFFRSYSSVMLHGFLLCMLSFSLTYFFLTRKKVFGWYFLYILFTLFFFIHRDYDSEYTGLFWYRIAFLRDLTWQPLSYLMYFLFAIHFVEFEKLSRSLFRLLKGLIVLLFIYLIVDLSLHYLHLYEARRVMYNNFRYVTGIPAIFCIIWTLTLKNYLAKILAAGSLFMVGGALTTLIIANSFSRTGNPWLDYHMIYMYIGTAIETMFFSIGLGYKNRLSDQAKLKAEADLQMEKEKAETEKLKTIVETQNRERERVALELHDDLGSGLTAIRMLSQMAQQQKDAKPYLEKIFRITGEVIDSMRHIIWTMNPANSNLTELIRRIKIYADEFLETANLRLVFKSTAELPPVKLQNELVRNLFLVVKECLNNIVKHADAQCVTFTVTIQNNTLIISIYDDGKGFSSTDRNGIHHGINSMKKRMNQIGGTVYFAKDKGTIAHIEVKLNAVS
jgi:signal transduction histidine kinase